MDLSKFNFVRSEVQKKGKINGKAAYRRSMAVARKDSKPMNASTVVELLEAAYDNIDKAGFAVQTGVVYLMTDLGTKGYTFQEVSGNMLKEYYTGKVKDNKNYGNVYQCEIVPTFFRK